jgi:hypothetical protein
MKYITRVKNNLRLILFRKIVNNTHSILTNKTGYFSIFLNDIISDSIQISGLFDSNFLIPLFDILHKHFEFNDKIAIDVGANIGNHTIFFQITSRRSYHLNPIQ